MFALIKDYVNVHHKISTSDDHQLIVEHSFPMSAVFKVKLSRITYCSHIKFCQSLEWSCHVNKTGTDFILAIGFSCFCTILDAIDMGKE